MPLILTNSYVYDLYKDRGKLSKHAFLTQLLSHPHLDIISEFKTAEEKEQYTEVKNVCYKRMLSLIDKVQKRRWFTIDPTAKEQTFLNLTKYPDLIHQDSQPLSLELIQSSQSSVASELEEEYPDKIDKKRKAFDDLKDQTKRTRTDDIYKDLLKAAADEGFEKEPWKFIAYLGKRAAGKVHNKEVAAQFTNIYEGKIENKVDVQVSLYLKEGMQI